MLIIAQTERRLERGKHKSFQQFRRRAEEADGSVGGALSSNFARFEDWEDERSLPNSRKVSISNRQVEQFCQVFKSLLSHIFVMQDWQTVWAWRSWVLGSIDHVDDVIKSVRREIVIQLKLTIQLPFNLTRDWTWTIGTNVGVLMVESFSYSGMFSVIFFTKSNRLIRGCRLLLPQ